MSADTEAAMLAAITAHFAAEDHMGVMTELRAVEVRAVTNNGDHPSGERMVYRAGSTYRDTLVLAAPDNTPEAAEPPRVRVRVGLPEVVTPRPE